MNVNEAVDVLRQVKGAFVTDGKTHDQIELALRVIENSLNTRGDKVVAGDPGLNQTAPAPISPAVTMPPVTDPRGAVSIPPEEVEQRMRRNHVKV